MSMSGPSSFSSSSLPAMSASVSFSPSLSSSSAF
jgi:hypothetical protein